MRTLLLLLPLALIGCNKPDPIEVCVEAVKRSERLQHLESCWRESTEGDSTCSVDGWCSKVGDKHTTCSAKAWDRLIILREPDWRKGCMKAAAGKD